MKQNSARTDDNNGIVLPADSDIGSSFIAKACNVGTFGAHDPREHGPVRQCQEANMGHELCMNNGVLDSVLCTLHSGLVASFDGPNRAAFLRILIVRDNFPENLKSRLAVINAS